jgi:hypothetical protein
MASTRTPPFAVVSTTNLFVPTSTDFHHAGQVVLHAQVKQSPVPGGLVMDVTGGGRTEQAIRAMVVPHAGQLDRMPAYAARTELIPGGVRLTVTAEPPDDPKGVARLRGLGFIGLLTEGAHHGPHHLAMAKGEVLPGHGH